MKVTKLTITNIGLIASEVIVLNKPLIIFYGEIRQGKSTILNAVRWVCGGEFPSDIIQHGKDEGSIELEFEGGLIRRTFYRSKKGGETKARAVVFIRDGKPVANPVSEIKRLLNPFLLDQNHLVDMNEPDRKRYFVELFGIDTKTLDTELSALETNASRMRIELGAFGEIDVTEHKRVDTTKLTEERDTIIRQAREKREKLEGDLEAHNNTHQARVQDHSTAVTEVRQFNMVTRKSHSDALTRESGEVARLKQELAGAEARVTAARNWLSDNPERKEPEAPVAPDTTALKQQILALHSPDTKALDTQIQEAGAANVRAEQYEANVARKQQKDAKSQELSSTEDSIRKKRAEKIALLASFNERHGIPGLVFTESGDFRYEDSDAGMLSTSQLMKLSSLLSEKYPEGFGIELIDRGESLGKSIFEYVERAKNEEKTILATVVGERPSKTPEEVGVFVVEKGKIIQ